MSNVDHYSVVKAVERCVRRTHPTMGGLPLDDKDVDSVIFFLSSWGCLLWDLLPQNSALRSYLGFIGSQDIDLIKLSTSIDAFKGLILYQSKLEVHDTWRDVLQRFKRAEGATHYYGVLTPVSPLLDELFLEFSPENFIPVFEWLTFIEKANLRGLDLSAELEEQYLKSEADMSCWTYKRGLIEDLSSILDEWTTGFDQIVEDAFSPDFGPGAVAEVTPSRHLGLAGKYALLSTDCRLEYMLKRLSTGDTRAIPTRPLDRTNKIVFVPKSLRKNRVISKEPAVLGYYQHAVFQCLDRLIQANSYLRDRMNLHDQHFQQDNAWSASLFGESATIDLSMASDSVTLALVKSVFKHPTLRRMLICTRSDQAELPSGKVVRLTKFAPMGSAVCFPVETLIFASACELACRRTIGVGSRRHNYGVYGDDIVIDRRSLDELLSILNDLHMKVNQDKSFSERSGLCFRESCGEFFARGVSVTPIRISRGLFIPREWNKGRSVTTPGPRLGLIALANQAWMRDYSTLRKCVLSTLRRGYPNFKGINFVDPTSEETGGLITSYDSLSNFNLASRSWSPPDSKRDWHLYSYQCWYVQQKPDTVQLRALGSESYETFSWFHWWRKRERDWNRHQVDGNLVFRKEYGVEILPEVDPTWPYQVRENLGWSDFK